VSCRRAYEIDIAAYLADPRAAEHADFRAHYPACAACAAEVRAWTELATRLGAHAPHPEPALLLRYEEAPAGLDAAAREAMRAHLAGCASCRDELAGLRNFASALAAQPASTRPVRTRGGFAAALRGLLWQPAFAYIVLFAVAAPLVYLLMTREPRIEQRLARLEARPPASAEESLRYQIGPPRQPAAAPAGPDDPSIDVRRLERLRSLGYMASPSESAGQAVPGRLLLRTDATGAKAVTVPLDVGAGANEVRIESTDGARSIRERIAEGAATAEIRLPSDWPAADYRVVVRSERGVREYQLTR
jgi:hypothetical protein